MKSEDAYRIALETRNLEIKLFWQRSNYFLVLNSSLAVGFFAVRDPIYAFGLSLMGFLVSFLWFCVNLGSKFWQSRWEERLSITERKIAPTLHFFDTDRNTIRADVRVSLDYENNKWRKPLNWLILIKPSVSRMMIRLSILFGIAWLFLVFRSWNDYHTYVRIEQQPVSIVRQSTDTASLHRVQKYIEQENADLKKYLVSKLAHQDSILNHILLHQQKK